MYFLPFFQVLCGVRALPLPIRFRWTFNNSYEANEVPSNKFSSNGSLSKLNYRAESEKDFGVVQCWAENKLGVSDTPCVFTLIPAGKFDRNQCCQLFFDVQNIEPSTYSIIEFSITEYLHSSKSNFAYSINFLSSA